MRLWRSPTQKVIDQELARFQDRMEFYRTVVYPLIQAQPAVNSRPWRTKNHSARRTRATS